MDGEDLGNDITNVLKDFKNLYTANEEKKQSVEELTELVALLREELKLARDAEHAAESNRSRCLGFVSQQQDVILKLLNVKEENENLKQTIDQKEKTISDIQNISLAERVRKDAEIQDIKQDYLRELIKIQETANKKVSKEKAELVSAMEEMRTSISKREEKINQQSEIIHSLQTKIKNLKERADVDVDTFQKKLAEQNRKHQAELDTWKLAELNQSMTYYQQSVCQGAAPGHFSHHPGQSGKLLMQMQDYQQRTNFQHQPLQNRELHSYQNVSNAHQYLNQNRPFIMRSKNYLPQGVPNISQPLPPPSEHKYQKSTDFITVNELFLENHNIEKESAEERDGEREKSEQKTQKNNTGATGPAGGAKTPAPTKRRKLFNADQNLL